MSSEKTFLPFSSLAALLLLNPALPMGVDFDDSGSLFIWSILPHAPTCVWYFETWYSLHFDAHGSRRDLYAVHTARTGDVNVYASSLGPEYLLLQLVPGNHQANHHREQLLLTILGQTFPGL